MRSSGCTSSTWPRIVARSVSLARNSSSSSAPVRSARSRICAVDSSPLAYSTRRPARALCAATSSSRVDLPTPGSPDRRTAAPGTMPPPSTRSNSPTPLVRRGASVVSMVVMGRAARPAAGATGVTERTMPVVSAASTTVPHCWHSPQRPAHLGLVHPHSVHRNAAAVVMRRVAMGSAYGQPPTSPRGRGGVPALPRSRRFRDGARSAVGQLSLSRCRPARPPSAGARRCGG